MHEVIKTFFLFEFYKGYYDDFQTLKTLTAFVIRLTYPSFLYILFCMHTSGRVIPPHSLRDISCQSKYLSSSPDLLSLLKHTLAFISFLTRNFRKFPESAFRNCPSTYISIFSGIVVTTSNFNDIS